MNEPYDPFLSDLCKRIGTVLLDSSLSVSKLFSNSSRSFLISHLFLSAANTLSKCHLNILNEVQTQSIYYISQEASASPLAQSDLSLLLTMHITHLSFIWPNVIGKIFRHACQLFYKYLLYLPYILINV